MLAVLLQAGLNSVDVVFHAHQKTGFSLHGAREASPHAFLVTIWNLVGKTGAPPAQLLATCAEALDAAAENARSARVQLAGPQSATRMVMALPLLALLGAMVSGYSPLTFLLTNPLGWILLAFAAVLVWCASRWSGRMVRKAQQWDWSRGMPAEVMALLLRAGSSLAYAREAAGHISEHYSTDAVHAALELQQCDDYVLLARTTGVSLHSLLRSVAEQERSDARMRAHERTEKLAVSLMLPLGLCILPAFIAVGVVPIVVSIISSTALSSV